MFFKKHLIAIIQLFVAKLQKYHLKTIVI